MLAWLLENIGWAALKALLGRFFRPKNPVIEAHDVEDKNRADLHDGDAGRILRDEWTKR